MRKHFPDLPILARARNRVHLYRLRDLGIEAIERETFQSSLVTARQALEISGMDPPQAARAVELFRKHDVGLLDVQYAVRQDEQQFIQTTAQAAAQLQELFEADVRDSEAPAPRQRRALTMRLTRIGDGVEVTDNPAPFWLFRYARASRVRAAATPSPARHGPRPAKDIRRDCRARRRSSRRDSPSDRSGRE